MGDCTTRLVGKRRDQAMANQTDATDKRLMGALVNCPKCGTDSPEGTRYCSGCGASLSGAKSSAPAAAKTEKKRSFFSRLFRKSA